MCLILWSEKTASVTSFKEFLQNVLALEMKAGGTTTSLSTLSTWMAKETHTMHIFWVLKTSKHYLVLWSHTRRRTFEWQTPFRVSCIPFAKRKRALKEDISSQVDFARYKSHIVYIHTIGLTHLLLREFKSTMRVALNPNEKIKLMLIVRTCL